MTVNAEFATKAPLLAWAALPLTLFVALSIALTSVPLPWSFHWSWVPSAEVDLAFHVDGLAAQMLLLIFGVGSLVFIYAAGYLSGTPEAGRVPVLLSLFLLAMVGAVTADNLLLLFVFWEMTSVLSFLQFALKLPDIAKILLPSMMIGIHRCQ